MSHFPLPGGLAQVASRNPPQPEFIQAVSRGDASIWPYVERPPATCNTACWSDWWNLSAWVQFRAELGG